MRSARSSPHDAVTGRSEIDGKTFDELVAEGPDGGPDEARERPLVNPDNRVFWEAVQQQRLVLQRCTCGATRYPFLPTCPTCGSEEWNVVEASGRGQVYSFVVVHDPTLPDRPTPYVTALVELEEGHRMISLLHTDAPDAVCIGLDVNVSFTTDHGFTFPDFVVTEQAAAS